MTVIRVGHDKYRYRVRKRKSLSQKVASDRTRYSNYEDGSYNPEISSVSVNHGPNEQLTGETGEYSFFEEGYDFIPQSMLS